MFMVTTSALFWLALMSTLHLPRVCNVFSASRVWVDRVFGAVLLALGLRIASQR